MYPGQAEKMADRMLTLDRTDALHLVNMTAGFDADAGIASVCETVYCMQWALVNVFAGCFTLFGVACYVFYLRTKYYLMETLADLKRASPPRRRRGSPRDCVRSRPFCLPPRRLELIEYFDVDNDGLEASELAGKAGMKQVMAAELA